MSLKILVVGIDRPGTTSHHRRLVLERLFPEAEVHRIDTDAPFARRARPSRSAAFRFRAGPAVTAVNRHVLAALSRLPERFDLAWVDKAVYLTPSTTRRLRECSRRLVHYTPDTAFVGNRSRHYERSGALYDLHVTTKSFEEKHYRCAFPGTPMMLTTQGYHDDVHFPRAPFEEKADEVAFVGLAEPSRFEAVAALLEAGIPVRLAGKGWESFVERHGGSDRLRFAGEGLSGDEYADFLSGARFGLGLVSKRFPERHTTRTFEIPACGTALVTERNEETTDFFDEGEAVFHSTLPEMVERIGSLRSDPETLRRIGEAGRSRVVADGRSYDRILAGVLSTLDLP